MGFLKNIIEKLQINKKNKYYLNLYYPKHVYDSLARREVQMILRQFNELFYEAYPETLNSQGAFHFIKPTTHGKQYEVKRDLALYKSRNVRKKELHKIEEFLNLKYIMEEQIAFYTYHWNKAAHIQKQIEQESYTSFFPQLYDNRKSYLMDVQQQCTEQVTQLKQEINICNEAIDNLVHHPGNFWSDAGRLVTSAVSESVKQALDAIDQSFKKKW